MIQFSLGWLHAELGESGLAPENLLDWYLDLDANQPERIATFLTEPAGKVSKAYILTAHETDDNLAVLSVVDVHSGNQANFPFNQPSGPRSPAIGPVVKRTQSKVKIAPTSVIADATLKHFRKIAEQGEPWSGFFGEASSILSRPRLSWNDQVVSGDHPNAYRAAISVIDEADTVFLTIRDSTNRLPGQVAEYANYLQEVLAETKYATNTAPALPETRCALTGITATCYANGLAGARVNLTNVDRAGAFPGVNTAEAGKRFAVSRQACDLLYIFRFHILPGLLAYVGGSKALVLPRFINQSQYKKFHRRFIEYVASLAGQDVESAEGRLTRLYLEEEEVFAGAHLVWANFGQKMEDVTFQLTDILPSRMRTIQETWLEHSEAANPFAPEHPVQAFQPDAWLNAPYNLYKRPGGKSAKTVNSDRLKNHVQFLLTRIYRGKPIEDVDILIEEGLDVARHYLRDMVANRNLFGLLREGHNPKKQTTYATLAGFIRAHHHFLGYLQATKIIYMESTMDDTEFEPLTPFFGENSGMKTSGQKAAFIAGILFGHLVDLQEKRGVNVAANALPLVKKYALAPRDLPNLVTRFKEKLTQYYADPNSKATIYGRTRKDTEALLGELARLSNFEPEPDISKTHLNYYLVLGQAMSGKIYYRKSEKEESTKGGTAE